MREGRRNGERWGKGVKMIVFLGGRVREWGKKGGVRRMRKGSRRRRK